MKEIIITSSVLILCIILIRLLLRGKISSRLQYALWLLVALRLIVPSSAQIHMAIGSVEEFRVMDLVELWESRVGDISERLERPVAFTAPLEDTAIGNLMARLIMGVYLDLEDTPDGPTSVFIAGKAGCSWLDILRGIWIGGMVVMAVWMIVTNVIFGRRLRKERKEFILPEGLGYQIWGNKAAKTRTLKLYTVNEVASPCLYGFPGREAIYLTVDITENPDKLRHVLTHEVCHRKHGDGFWSILRGILLTVYWMNPLVWAAAILSKRDCELACDEAALIMLGESERISYGETLLSIITRKGRLSDIACTATTMTGGGKSVKERIRLIANKPKVLGTAVAAVLVVAIFVSVLVFTKSPQVETMTWEAGELAVISGDMQVILPATIAGLGSYRVEEESGDIVIYHAASGMEVGRFAALSYGTAVMLMENGGEIVPLGDYGQNINLKQYMGFLYDGYMYDNETSVTTHTYTPYSELPDDSMTGHNDTFEDGSTLYEQMAKPEGVPGTDSNDDTTYMMEDESWSVMPLEESADYQPAEKNGEDAEDSVDYLPNEQITTISVRRFSGSASDQCYVYLKADYSSAQENDLGEMESINRELEACVDRVIVTRLNQEASRGLFEKLAKNKTEYLGDAAKTGALVHTLPCPDGFVYQDMALHTEPGEILTLDIYYGAESATAAGTDSDMMFFNAVMLFATIENLEECNFIMDGGAGTVTGVMDHREGETQGVLGHYETVATESINYKRKDLEAEFGALWMAEPVNQDTDYAAWLEMLYTQVTAYLFP